MQKKFSLKNNRLAKTIIVSGSILIVVAFIILRYEGFLGMLSGLLGIFRPIIIGAVLAFALNRPMNFFQYHYRRLFAKIKKSRRRRRSIGKGGRVTTGKAPFILGCVTTYAVTVAILVSIILFVIPQIYDSILLFGKNVNGYIDNFKEFIETNKIHFENILGNSVDIGAFIEKIANKLNDLIANIAEHIPEMLEATMNFTSDIIGIVVDTLIGIVFSVYILLDKENLKKNAGKIAQIVIKGDHYTRFRKITSMAYTTFSNFISGQIIEACIVAILCFIGMNIFGFDYALLISVIVGITNIIPIVGPIIGTIPGAFILLLINPIDAVWFVVFIISIQQIDSNFIYPRVVGNKVGLPSLWVLFAITIGGGLAGVTGMILGVPIFAILYAIISEKLDEAEKKDSTQKTV